MAWCSSSTTNAGLVENLVSTGVIHSDRVIAAMHGTDRGNYCPPTPAPAPLPKVKAKTKRYNFGPYADAPQSIGWKQTISAPFIHGGALERFWEHFLRKEGKDRSRIRVLDVGSGSGVMCGYFSRLFGERADIVGVEIVEELVEKGKDNLIRDAINLMNGTVQVNHGAETAATAAALPTLPAPPVSRVWNLHLCGTFSSDDSPASLLPFSSYTYIYVGCGSPTIPPNLLKLLEPNGRMLIPLSGQYQNGVIFEDCVDRKGCRDISGPSDIDQDSEVAKRMMNNTVTLVDRDVEGVVRIKEGDWPGSSKIRFVPFVRDKVGGSGVEGVKTGKDRMRQRVQETNTKTTTNMGGERVKGQTSSRGRVDFDKRYSRGWAYSKCMNETVGIFRDLLLKEEGKPFSSLSHGWILSFGCGQGRNEVGILEGTGEDVHVLGVDKSSVGIEKMMRLGGEKNVLKRLEGHIADVTDIEFRSGILALGMPQSVARDASPWIGLMSVFCGMGDTNGQRRCVLREGLRKVTEGGFVCIEAFAEGHGYQEENVVPGPSDDQLVSMDSIETDLYGEVDVLFSECGYRLLNEGRFHRGMAKTVRIVGRRIFAKGQQGRLFQPMKTWRDNVDDVLSTLSSSQSKREDIGMGLNSLHHSAANDDKIVSNTYNKACRNKTCGRDLQILFAANIVGYSIRYAMTHYHCIYCGFLCYNCCCRQLFQKITKTIAADVVIQKEENRNVTPVHFEVLCHPREFGRSTSTSKVFCMAYNRWGALLGRGGSASMRVYGVNDGMDSDWEEDGKKKEATALGTAWVLYPREGAVSVEEFLSKQSEDSQNNHSKDGNDMEPKCNEKLTPRIYVPDGSWSNTNAIVDDFIFRMRGKAEVKFVKIGENVLSGHRSCVLEKLYRGSGEGRASTAEAMCLFLREGGWRDGSDMIQICLDALVERIGGEKDREIRGDDGYADTKGSTVVSSLVPLLRSHLDSLPASAELFPLGLRTCNVCGATVGTIDRFRKHLEGKRHLNEVAKSASNQEGWDELGEQGCKFSDGKAQVEGKCRVNTQVNMAQGEDLQYRGRLVKELFQEYSTRILMAAFVESPDAGFAIFSENRIRKGGEQKDIEGDDCITTS